jgi:radical SAM protein with 4Fe4S-binding SPASM domain
MRLKERVRGLLRSPKLTWGVLARGRYSFVYDLMPVTMSEMPAAKRINLFKAGANLLYRRAMPWSFPLHMQFELANFCNLRCPVCPTGIGAVRRAPRIMDPDLFERLIDEVGPYLLTASLWAWGEPLLHPDLQHILRAIRQHDIAILLSTNGQRLNDEKALEALTEEPPTYLIVAIDGLTDETNAQFRIGARLEPILEGVRRIAEFKRLHGRQLPVLHMRYIVMKHNQHEIPDLIEFARNHHFDVLTVRTLLITDTGPSHETHRGLVPDSAELQPYEYRNGHRIRRKDFICQEPFWFPTVFADGTLVPCEQDFNSQQSLGIISEKQSFSDLWFSKRAAEIRKVIRDRPNFQSFCVNCPYRDRDETDSSISAHFLNNAIDYPNLV